MIEGDENGIATVDMGADEYIQNMLRISMLSENPDPEFYQDLKPCRFFCGSRKKG